MAIREIKFRQLRDLLLFNGIKCWYIKPFYLIIILFPCTEQEYNLSVIVIKKSVEIKQENLHKASLKIAKCLNNL